MPAALFAAASGIPPDRVRAVVPPACRRPVEPRPDLQREGDYLLVELGPWGLPPGTHHLVPALGVLDPRPCTFRFELAAATAAGPDGERWSDWVATATIGPGPFPSPAAPAGGLAVDVDEYRSELPLTRARLRVRFAASDAGTLATAPWLVTLSAAGPGPPAARPRAGGARLAVPALSQMTRGGAVAARVCSPTSVAMVLAYFGVAAEVGPLAAEIFHPALDRYGVWPAAVAAAARRGLAGYLLRFPDWDAAAWCLDRGLPVIASVRYGAGELTGAAMAETSGHLLVLRGREGDEVLVNDPAAPTDAAVPRRYRLDELVRAWLERSGVGYVFFPPA